MWFPMRFVILLVIFITHNNYTESLRILGIFPLAGKSHFYTGEKILKSLVKKGHSVDMLSHFPQKKSIVNYTDISIAGSIEEATNNLEFKEAIKFQPTSMKYFVEEGGNKICDLLSHKEIQLLLSKNKKTYDVIVIEIFLAPCYLAFGRHFDAPVVGVVTCKQLDWLYQPFGNPVNTAYFKSLFSSTSEQMTFIERLKNTLIFNNVVLQTDYYMEHQCYHVEKFFNIKLSSIKELYNDVGVVLFNSHYSINDVKEVVPAFVDIGGIHVNQNQTLSKDVREWLDESVNDCVYISFGSMVRIETLPLVTILEFYEMFRRIAPTRVLMKIAKPHLLPPNLPSNVKTSTWLPQIAVLKHKNVKAFVTHGGLLGTQEAIAWGVPMIGIPIFSDQFSNIDTYVKKNLAVYLDVHKLTAETLTNAVNDILKNPIYQKSMREVSSLFMDRPMSAEDTAVYWVEYVARHGNRLRSPATKLSWWQYYLIDVYGFIIAFILILLWTIKKFIHFSMQAFFMQWNYFKNISKAKKS
ncbi:hypothetical protein HCN44_009449 [Aphidius gifuensis]|uniref:UDP-glucuronosyltransferase n=1 Tax=Aphidius gifuensis TaxID=684658 RepID=A0A834Y3T6_APHGI|nr:UDP-glucosyltransferase 2-like [Aphidius gifuensis]KAF7998051.1 hypothetical protein HCN44_009449 [Aphidius gifuensis]